MGTPVNEVKIESYMLSSVWTLTDAREEVLEALSMIDQYVKTPSKALPIKLLAVRRYLRIGGKRLEGNWSWTNAEVARMKSQEPTRTLYAEADKVRRNFATANPGYRLTLSPVRSLERQSRLWSNNPTIKKASAHLLAEMDAELQKPDYPNVSGGPIVQQFARKLHTSRVHPEPTSAAPGTSGHGRGTAVDFIVMQGSTKVAGTDSRGVRTTWDGAGWTAKLKAAVSGTRLKGPLKNPYEPWHWSL